MAREDITLDQVGPNFGGEWGRKKREKRERRRRMREKLHLLSKFSGDRTFSFCRSKKKSSSMRRGLHIETRILVFRQTS